MSEFGLDFEWTRVLFSFLYHLVREDIVCESNVEKKSLKQQWLTQWRKSIETLLENLEKEGSHVDIGFTQESSFFVKICRLIARFLSLIASFFGRKPSSPLPVPKSNSKDFHLIIDYKDLERRVRASRLKIDRKTLYIILLEISLFTLYHPLGTEQDKEYKNLSLSDTFRNEIKSRIKSYADILGVDRLYVDKFKSSYKEFIEQLKEKRGFMKLVLGGFAGAAVLAVAAAFAVPLIVAVLAPLIAPGLYGAAAVSAVLAALGGGAIAAGGFGMAGGSAVIIGGGAILGAGAGTGIGALFAQSPEAVVPHAAKFLVVFGNIILTQKNISKQKIVNAAKTLIQELRESITSYEDRIYNLRLESGNHQDEIKNLEKVVSYLKKALNRSQDMLKEFLQNDGLG